MVVQVLANLSPAMIPDYAPVRYLCRTVTVKGYANKVLINCKFTRFFLLCNISKLTVTFDNDYFRFVPAPPSGKFEHIYTDEELYKAFNLPQKYIDVIESVIKERK